MRNLFVALLSTLLFVKGHAQIPDEDKAEIMKAVHSLFTAMETNDGTLATRVFYENAQLHTISTDDKGTVMLHVTPVAALIRAIGQPRESSWSEPIWNEKIESDGMLASVWATYAFFVGNMFHHCGSDAFHLIKTDQGWKIFHLTDTRQTDGCVVPEEVMARYHESLR
ncbi:MAG: nuclear transport factor 2 family protein [Cyclobacteriaceae bacterium]|nr:nuclear transport factor 2 family protein [Cyclobacteriaceae bacterium]